MNRRNLAIAALASLALTGGAGAPHPEIPAQPPVPQHFVISCDPGELVCDTVLLADLEEILPVFGNSLHRALRVSTPLPAGFGETPAKIAPAAVDFPGRAVAEMAALMLPEAIKVVKEAVRRIDVVEIVHWLLG